MAIERSGGGLEWHQPIAGLPWRSNPKSPRTRWTGYAWSALAIVLLTAVARAAEPWIGYPSIDLFYLLPVILAATFFGLRPGVATAIASGVFYNFFFVPPQHTFHIYDPQDVATVIVLVIVAIVISQLAGRVRAQAEAGERRAQESAAITAFTDTLAALSDETKTAQAICSAIVHHYDVDAVLLTPRQDGLSVTAAAPDWVTVDADAHSVASADYMRGNGEAVPIETESDWRFWPLAAGLGTMAVVGVRGPRSIERLTQPGSGLFAAIIDRAAQAIERLRVEEELRSMDALRERERLRSTLLSSIGHDLRTPLTALTAAAEALGAREEYSELVSTIRGEAKRLRRFFDDLIDMTRIESGSLAPRAEPIDLTDAVSAALDDLRLAMEGHKVRVDVSPDLPLVRTDSSLLHHILINLLDNAAKFSPAGSEVQLQGMERDGGVELCVTDEGSGLPAGSEAKVFDTFSRLEGSDRRGGTGLGLAIVKGFAEAMGLHVSAANRQEREGARLSVFFPAKLVVQQVGLGE